MLPSPSVGKCSLRRWSGMKWTSCFYHKLPREIVCFRDTSPSDSEAITPREQRSREGEAGMSLLDQLIGQPETEEQLRKLVALFSEVQRWRPKVHKTEFLFQRSGIFISFFFSCREFEQFKMTFRFQFWTKMYYLCPCIWNLYQHWSISWKGFSKDLHFQAKTEYLTLFHLATSQLHLQISHSWFGSKLLGQRLTHDHIWPRVAKWMSELILFKQYQQNASQSDPEQIQAFALALAMCAINNSQQTWSMPGKAVEWAISSKHRKGLLGVSECWCIPAEPVSWTMNQTLPVEIWVST